MPLLFNGGKIASGTTVPLTNDTGSDRGTVTATYDGQTLTMKLPTQTDIVVGQQTYDILSADGNTTLASALADVPISLFHGLLLPADHAVVPDGGSVALQDSSGNALDNGTGGVATNDLVITVPPSITGGGSGPSQGDQVGVWNAANDTRMFIGTADFSTGPLKILGPATVAALQNAQAGVVVNQFDGTGSKPLTVAVANNGLTLTLSDAKTRVAQDADTVQVGTAFKTVDAAVTIANGAYGQFVISNATDALVSDSDALEIQNSGNTKSVQGSTNVSSSSLIAAVLPGTATPVEDGDQVTCQLDGVQKVLTFSVANGEIASVTSADPA